MGEIEDTLDVNGSNDGDRRELRILITNADKTGTDITKMSNFLDAYVTELTARVSDNELGEFFGDIPAADFSIVLEAIGTAEAVFADSYSFVLDYDSLPNDVKSKLKSGEYSLGPSRQVDGNVRAVVVDGDGTRVKDITLKEVKDSPDLTRNIQSIAEQVQMRQVYQKLDEVQALQQYQIDRDRDRDIVTPFLSARDYILRAQLTDSESDRVRLLELADAKLVDALNGVYSDLVTTSMHLRKKTKRPIFQNQTIIQGFIRTLSTDLQLATQFAGVQMRILDYLGDTAGAKAVLANFQSHMKAFCKSPVGDGRFSAAMLMHRSAKYPDEHIDYWYEFTKMVHDLPEPDFGYLEGRSVLLLEPIEPNEDDDDDDSRE